jgi:hypothetical protein
MTNCDNCDIDNKTLYGGQYSEIYNFFCLECLRYVDSIRYNIEKNRNKRLAKRFDK